MREARTNGFVIAISGALAVLAAWLGTAAAARAQLPLVEPAPARAELNLAAAREADNRRLVIGAYYYPWYGVNDRPLDHDWHTLLRAKLTPQQQPRAGWRRSDDPATIAEHIAQSRQATLDFWAVSWWGPGSATDRTLREAILKHPDADQLRYAVMYESTGRLGGMDRPRYDNLGDDFAYLKENVFPDPRYLRINGRPVVFVYLSREYFRNRGLEELAAARGRAGDVYVIGDDVFGSRYNADWARAFDAVTAYDVYGQSAGPHRATRRAVDALAANYAEAREKSNSVGVAFAPAVAPGYNDRPVREGHAGAPRYFVDEPDSQEGDFFRDVIRRAALPHLDDRCGRMMLVTSFNEWYEDSQIETTAGTEGVTSTDNSASQKEFTQGDRYSDYGDLYLRILREVRLDGAGNED
jgi:glycoprotein endo-alpha-1,2-mannosidase